jgi:hypothetical protein
VKILINNPGQKLPQKGEKTSPKIFQILTFNKTKSRGRKIFKMNSAGVCPRGHGCGREWCRVGAGGCAGNAPRFWVSYLVRKRWVWFLNGY